MDALFDLRSPTPQHQTKASPCKVMGGGNRRCIPVRTPNAKDRDENTDSEEGNCEENRESSSYESESSDSEDESEDSEDESEDSDSEDGSEGSEDESESSEDESEGSESEGSESENDDELLDSAASRPKKRLRAKKRATPPKRPAKMRKTKPTQRTKKEVQVRTSKAGAKKTKQQTKVENNKIGSKRKHVAKTKLGAKKKPTKQKANVPAAQRQTCTLPIKKTKKRRRRTSPADGDSCMVCLETASQRPSVKAVCCRCALHLDCIHRWAESSGNRFRCPGCNNNKAFLRQMRRRGLVVDKDAEYTWKDAIDETVLQWNFELIQCEAPTCLCAWGRKYEPMQDRGNSVTTEATSLSSSSSSSSEHDWIMLLCSGCGSNGMHVRCAGFSEIPEEDWQCEPCRLGAQEDVDDY